MLQTSFRYWLWVLIGLLYHCHSVKTALSGTAVNNEPLFRIPQNLQNQEDSTGFLFLISNHQTNGIQKGFPRERKIYMAN